MTLTSCAFNPCHRNTMRHCALIRMLWKPTKSPLNASNLLPGGERRSFSDCAAFRTSSLFCAASSICDGRSLTRLLDTPLYRSDDARSPNDAIIQKINTYTVSMQQVFFRFQSHNDQTHLTKTPSRSTIDKPETGP